MDEKRLAQIEDFARKSGYLEEAWDEHAPELLRLARLGLWAEKECVAVILKEFAQTWPLVKDALAALPREEG